MDKMLVEKWLDSMKIALLEKDTQRAFELTQNLPFDARAFSENVELDSKSLENLDMIKELMAQAISLLESEKKDAKTQLDKIKQARNFFSE